MSNQNDGLSSWIKSNPSFLWVVAVQVVAVSMSLGAQYVQQSHANQRIDKLENVISSFITIPHRVTVLENSINSINVNFEKQRDSTSEISSRVTRIESLTETIHSILTGNSRGTASSPIIRR